MMNSKFRGTLFGVLCGDCVGALYEGESQITTSLRTVLKNCIDQYEKDKATTGPSSVQLKFTDDTAMTKSVANTLMRYNPVNYQKDLAINFVKDYFSSPKRGYGNGVIELFHVLKRTEFQDVLLPATHQFQGRGSFGNGAAMRISPVALYCANKSEDFLIDLVNKTSEITHANVIAVNGAILQSLAIHKNLKMSPTDTFDKLEYVDELLLKFEKIEKGADRSGIPEEKCYTKQLNEIKRLLSKPYEPSDEEVVNLLGHSVNALYSVPTALYCFLKNVDQENAFRKTLEYTISLGGDTDTIASMSCALIGSFHGDTHISKNLIENCESHEEMAELAQGLLNISS